MGLVYSTYDAKVRFSEILRHVRAGRTVTVLHRGEPVAEIRGIQPGPKTIEKRLEDLERRGVLVRSGRAPSPLAPVANRPGALKRFLRDRNE